MKLKRLLSLAMICVAWVGGAWADTSLLTAANGWQKVTDLSSLTLSDYYFAFVDNDKDLMLSFEEGVNQSSSIDYKTMVYRTGARAEMTPAMLWTLEDNNSAVSGSHIIKSAVYQDKFLQTEWDASWFCRTHDNGGGDNSWGAWIFAFADNSWTIQNGKYADKGYLGPWNDAFTNGMNVAGNKTGNNVGHFQIYAIKRSDVDWLTAATQSNPANISYKITNANAGFKGTSGWTAAGTNIEFKRNGNVGFDGVAGFLEPSMWGSDTGYDFTVTQTINNLPTGKYKVRAAGQNSSGNTLTLNCGGTNTFTYPSQDTSNGTIDQAGNTVTAGSGVAGWVWGGTDNYLDATGSLTITFHTSASTQKQWANFDNVELYYLGKNLRDGSTPTTSGVSATAATWYAIQVQVAGSYTLTPSAGTVYYTQNGELMPDEADAEATSTTTATDLDLKVGYLYVKASEDATINLTPNTKTYTVGTAIQSANYIQNGQTVTITYGEAGTNDTEATFAKLGDVTFNGANIDVTVSGRSFSFTVPDNVETSTAYTLSIPAGAFGYEGHATCEAQDITLTTPAVFDGTYYIKTADGKYISRGAKYNTEAALDPWGIALNVATDSNNGTTLYFTDNDKPLGVATGGDMYTDNTSLEYRYTIIAAEGGYSIKNIAYGKYVVAGNNSDGKPVANTAAEPYIWTLVAPATHTAEMTALKNYQAAEAAKAAGLDMTTVVALEAEVETWDGNKPVTLSALDNTNEYYQSTGERKGSVEISKTGLYKLTIPAYNRTGSADNAYKRYTNETDALTAYIYMGDAKTQIRSLYSEAGKDTETSDYVKPANATQWWPNTKATGTAEFNAGKYANDVWVWLEAGQTYNFGIVSDGNGKCDNWIWFDTPTLTYYSQNLYPKFAELYEQCKPWTEGDEYATTYNSYADYNEATDQAALKVAIDYMTTNFDTYAWDNASPEHPYLVEGVISRSECTENGGNDPTIDWAGSGRSTATGQHWSGDASRVYFTQNHENGAARKQTVTIPNKGLYMLKTSIRPINSASYAEISVGSETVRTYGPTGTEGGTIATDGTEYESVAAGIAAGATFANDNKGYGWIYQNIIFTSDDNETKTISINLSNANVNREADCGGMFLYYVGQNYDKVDGNTHYYYGNYSAPSFEVTEAIPVIDATKATVSGATVKRTNPNGLVYLSSGSTADGGNNVVTGGTCANLVLTDGYPFTATKNFEATSAKYTMTAIAGGKFGTLVLPFAATLPPGGKAYSLDADINVIDGNVRGSELTSLQANTPALVTAAGDYTGANVDIAVSSASTQYTNGNLTGVYQSTQAPVGSYVLQKHGETVAFYLVGDVQPTIKPFRAFIPAQSSNVKAISVIFDGEATAIDGINAENAENSEIYDLCGRKVTKAQKGVYIVNGKKMIIK